MKRHVGVLLVGTLVIMSFAGWRLLNRVAGDRQEIEGKRDENSDLRLKFSDGETDVFALDYQADGGLDLSQGANGSGIGPLKRTVHVKLLGKARKTILKVDGVGQTARIRLRLELDDLEVMTDDHREPELEAMLRAELGRAGVVYAVDARGRIGGLWPEEDLSKTSLSYLRQVTLATRIELPEAVGAPAWTASEDDQNGSYVAEYGATGIESNVVSITKRVSRYTDLNFMGSGKGMVASAVNGQPSGSMTAKFDMGRHRITAAEGVTGLAVTLNGKVVATSSVHVSLHLMRTEAAHMQSAQARTWGAPHTGAGSVTKTASSPLVDPSARRDAEMARERLVLGATKLDDLFVELEEIDRKSVRPGAQTSSDLVLKLTAMLTVHPELVDDVAEHALDVAGGSQSFSFLVGSLGLVGSRECQAALVRVGISAVNDPKRLHSVLIAASTVPWPTADLVDWVQATSLDAQAADLRAAAVLTLGTMAFNLARDGDPRGEQISTALHRKLVDATEEPAKQLYIGALGNAADPATMKDLAAATESADEATRSAAVLALRNVVSNAEARRALLRVLSDDPLDHIRYLAAVSLGMLDGAIDGETAAFLATRYKKEPSAVVRSELVQCLWKGRAFWAGAYAAVSAAAESDTSRDVRRLAASLRSMP